MPPTSPADKKTQLAMSATLTDKRERQGKEPSTPKWRQEEDDPGDVGRARTSWQAETKGFQRTSQKSQREGVSAKSQGIRAWLAADPPRVLGVSGKKEAFKSAQHAAQGGAPPETPKDVQAQNSKP